MVKSSRFVKHHYHCVEFVIGDGAKWGFLTHWAVVSCPSGRQNLDYDQHHYYRKKTALTVAKQKM